KGWLMKQKHGKTRTWLKRYFVLHNDELRYYKTKTDNNTLAVISLDHYSLVPNAEARLSIDKKYKPHTFCLISDDETKYNWPDYFLQASSDEERQIWVDHIQKHVSQSKSILDKWLERLDLPVESSPVLPNNPNVNKSVPYIST
ncbi:PH-domain-containing protein, partial [Backusella circina FSU 941]